MARRLIAKLLECKMCGHQWLPYKTSKKGKPRRCPNTDCYSTLWEHGPKTPEEFSERTRKSWAARRARMAEQSKQEALFA